jgi:hypothetical protein
MPTNRICKAVLIATLLGTSAMPLSAQAPARQGQAQESVYVYYQDELATSSTLPTGLRQARQEDPLFAPCRAAEPQIAPFLVPLVLFGVKLFGSVVERHLSDREAQRLEAMSRTYAQVRTNSDFPVRQGVRLRCLVVDRGTLEERGNYRSGALYVIGLRAVDGSAFTIEPIAARIDATPVALRPRDRVNATVALTVQSVVANREGTNELVTLPAFSMNFRNLAVGTGSSPPARRSPVMPVIRATGAPTSVAIAVTEANASLDRVKQQIALDQANRAALLAAIGEAVKTALTD